MPSLETARRRPAFWARGSTWSAPAGCRPWPHAADGSRACRSRRCCRWALSAEHGSRAASLPASLPIVRQSHRMRKRSALPAWISRAGTTVQETNRDAPPAQPFRYQLFWEQSVGDYNFIRIIASLPEATMSIRDRGVTSMDRMKHPEIVSKGGKAAHQKGTAH